MLTIKSKFAVLDVMHHISKQTAITNDGHLLSKMPVCYGVATNIVNRLSSSVELLFVVRDTQ